MISEYIERYMHMDNGTFFLISERSGCLTLVIVDHSGRRTLIRNIDEARGHNLRHCLIRDFALRDITD